MGRDNKVMVFTFLVPLFNIEYFSRRDIVFNIKNFTNTKANCSSHSLSFTVFTFLNEPFLHELITKPLVLPYYINIFEIFL